MKNLIRILVIAGIGLLAANLLRAAEHAMLGRLEILNVKTERTARDTSTIITLGIAPEQSSEFQIAGSCSLIYKGDAKHEAGQVLNIEIK